jgi:hypothetical protein
MAHKPQRLPPYKLPRCGGSDGDPTTGSPTEGTFRCCRALATYRIEWTTETTKTVRGGGFRWELRAAQELSCDRHLPRLLERAERGTEWARSPDRDWSPDDVPDPVLIRLTFELDKRAKAHGNTLYFPVEAIVTGPVEFKLF